jgi:hypothetical protein
LRKRVELASAAVANMLNTSMFGIGGPVKRLAEVLGATGEHTGECVLQQIIPPGYTLPIFPLSDAEASSRPLVKNRYNPELHIAIGLLRCFDARENSVDGGGEPSCDFRSRTREYIKGVNALPHYGPLFFEMMKVILIKLSPIHAGIFNKAETSEGVETAAASAFKR